MNTLGLELSVLDGSERQYEYDNGFNLPDSFSYESFLPPVLDQGETSICVPCTLSTFINWRKNLDDGSTSDHNIDLFGLYSSKTTNGNGMTFKDALKHLRHKGVETDFGLSLINTYAMVKTIEDLKAAIVANGPCAGALPVYSNRNSFWEQMKYDSFSGYHAVAIVGYNKDGFIIRNSWGKEYGKRGYFTIPYDMFDKFAEIWTITD